MEEQYFREALRVDFVAWGPVFPPGKVTPGLVLQKLCFQFENKYALRMDSARRGVIERSAPMLYTRELVLAGSAQDQGAEVGSWARVGPTLSLSGGDDTQTPKVQLRWILLPPIPEAAACWALAFFSSSHPRYSSPTLTSTGLILTDSSVYRSFCAALSPEHQTSISIYLVCNLFFIFC